MYISVTFLNQKHGSTLSPDFYLRKNRNKKSEESEIYLRITMNSKLSEMSIGRKVPPDKWNSKAQKMLGRSEAANEVNSYIYIYVLKNKLNRIHQSLTDKNSNITASLLMQESIQDWQRVVLEDANVLRKAATIEFH